MVQIKNNDLQDLLLKHYKHQLQGDLLKIYAYEQKYGMNFDQLTRLEQEKKEENFEMADDQIHWEGLVHFSKETYKLIKDIENGLFEIIE